MNKHASVADRAKAVGAGFNPDGSASQSAN